MIPVSEYSADQSASILARCMRICSPFFFARYGDGALECINKLGIGFTCDGEQYSEPLATALLEAWRKLMRGTNVYVGDWRTASFGKDRSGEYPAQYAALFGDARPALLHFEALLLTRESKELLDFYRTVRNDPRPKVFMGPAENAGAAKMLRARHVVTPMRNLFEQIGNIEGQLASEPFDVLLYGAGMAGTIPAVNLWQRFPHLTCINLGSAMDPLFRGTSRSGQLGPERAREFFHELL